MRLSGFLIIIMCFVLGLSCNSSKKTSNEEMPPESQFLLIELESSLDGTYISKTYSQYEPEKIARSNRTLNKYRAKFNCSEAQLAELLSLLENNVKVLNVQRMEVNDSKKAYKSTNSGKTQPIRN